jgi:di/tricarboxylate transporter
MDKAHLIFGIVVFVVFLVTGRFMRADFPDKEIISQEFRLLMRSRHIYILLSSFIHIALGLYLAISPSRWRKYLQISGSFLLMLGSVLLIYAFFYETYSLNHFSDISRYGLYATLAGTAFHLFSRFR